MQRQIIVERIYIVDKEDLRFCHIFINGSMDEDYTGFLQTAGYIKQKPPLCVIQNSIAFTIYTAAIHSLDKFNKQGP